MFDDVINDINAPHIHKTFLWTYKTQIHREILNSICFIFSSFLLKKKREEKNYILQLFQYMIYIFECKNGIVKVLQSNHRKNGP